MIKRGLHRLLADNDKGFTLIEVFLTASLVGLLLVTIFSTYTAGIRIWRNVKNVEFVADRDFFMGFEKMKKELAGYIRELDEVEFVGDDESLTFPYVVGLKTSEVTYRFSTGESALLREAIEVSEALGDNASAPTSKLFNAERVEFSYLFYDEAEDVGDWVSSFVESDNDVPEAIKLDIRRDGKKFTRYIFIPK